jgi:hypothetical protein
MRVVKNPSTTPWGAPRWAGSSAPAAVPDPDPVGTLPWPGLASAATPPDHGSPQPRRGTPRSTPPDVPSAQPPATPRPPVPPPPVHRSALSLLGQARRGLAEARGERNPAVRYATAHLAALRAAAAVVAARTQPAAPGSRRHRPASVWSLLTAHAPELGEWAAYFAAGAATRARAEAGVPSAVTAREADDLIRDASTFLEVVTETLGLLSAA